MTLTAYFPPFTKYFNKLVNKHAPMKTISKRKAKQFSKPWITEGLRKSIRVKNKLSVSGDRVQYKMYRKKNLYVNSHKQTANMKKTWEEINSILARKSNNSKPISSIKNFDDSSLISSNPNRIANILNKHFASVGPKLANKLPSVQRNYFDFLSRSNSPDMSFAFNLVIPSEVKLEISRIPNNKSDGLYSCPTQILKCSSNVISNTLAEIINLSISTEVYPNKLKMAKIFPIFKTDNDTDPSNTRAKRRACARSLFSNWRLRMRTSTRTPFLS